MEMHWLVPLWKGKKCGYLFSLYIKYETNNFEWHMLISFAPRKQISFHIHRSRSVILKRICSHYPPILTVIIWLFSAPLRTNINYKLKCEITLHLFSRGSVEPFGRAIIFFLLTLKLMFIQWTCHWYCFNIFKGIPRFIYDWYKSRFLITKLRCYRKETIAW